MGVSWAQLGSLNAPQAARLGVLPAAAAAVAHRRGDSATTVTLAPLSGRGGTRALRLTDAEGVDYWLEYRTATGRDAWLGTAANRYRLQTGVLLHRAGGLPDTSLLLDGTPAAAAAWDGDLQSALPVGAPVPVSGGDFTVVVAERHRRRRRPDRHADAARPPRPRLRAPADDGSRWRAAGRGRRPQAAAPPVGDAAGFPVPPYEAGQAVRADAGARVRRRPAPAAGGSSLVGAAALRPPRRCSSSARPARAARLPPEAATIRFGVGFSRRRWPMRPDGPRSQESSVPVQSHRPRVCRWSLPRSRSSRRWSSLVPGRGAARRPGGDGRRRAGAGLARARPPRRRPRDEVYADPLSWIETEDGDAVRVPTDQVDDLPLGATVEVVRRRRGGR